MLRHFGNFILMTAAFAAAAIAAEPAPNERTLSPKRGYGLIDDLFSDSARKRDRASEKLMEAGDETMGAALMEALFFSGKGAAEAAAALDGLFGKSFGPDYKRWVEYIGSREDVVPKEGYLALKARLFGWIDPNFAEFLDPKHARNIRPEEIIYGGVKKDGIPALFGPPFLPAAEADWMLEKEPVFGAFINGEARAYPFRILDWHEMANDVIGGQPVSLAYCTMCGAGILYDTTKADGGFFTFGTSGLLYRSNKLMYDHQTNTLWNQMTGEPAMGSLVGKDVRLKPLPLTVTTWAAWRELHPDTLVASPDTGYNRRYTPGAAYGDYFSSPDLRFPVWNKPTGDAGLADKDWMWVVVVEGRRKAYAMKRLRQITLLMDRIGETTVVLITNPSSGAVRVYRAGDRQLSRRGEAIVDQNGAIYALTEEALVSADGQTKLARLPGHRAYWFSWGSFFPEAETLR